MRLSFWPAIRFEGLAGLTLMLSSACRRKVQSWLTRTFPSAFRMPHPRDLPAAPRALAPPAPLPLTRGSLPGAAGFPADPLAAPVSPAVAATSFEKASFAEVTKLPERVGSVRNVPFVAARLGLLAAAPIGSRAARI